MRLMNHHYVILSDIYGNEMLKFIEKIGRIAYRSEHKITEESSHKFIEKIIKNGHESVIEHGLITVKMITNRGLCYDEETKVLTTDGWKYFNEVNKDDMFYSLNDNNDIEFIKANKIVKEKYNGKMDHWKSTQIDLLVTPNHNLWLYDYDKRVNRCWKFIKSQDANNRRYKFKKSANPIKERINDYVKIPGYYRNFGNIEFYYEELLLKSGDFYELLGWWLTDGSLYFPKNGSGNKLNISQTKEYGRERIEYLLNKLELNYRIDKAGFIINSPPLFWYLFNNFIISMDNVRKSYYLTLPRKFILNLTPSNIERLLDGIIGGNGSKHTGGPGFQIYTASYKFAEDLVELCLLAGKCANIYKIPPRVRIFPGGYKSECREQYVVSIVTTNDHLWSRRSAIKEKIDYTGNVYCVELEKFHRLYIMRNGKSCWCGNSHEVVRHRLASYTQSSTRYIDSSKYGCEFIIPSWINEYDTDVIFRYNDSGKWDDLIHYNEDEIEQTSLIWISEMYGIENSYKKLRKLGLRPEQAREILPNSTRAEIVMSANLREWRHFFKLRTSKAAHPDMQLLTKPILKDFKVLIPIVFDDIIVEGE